MTINYFVNNQRSNGYFLYGYDFLNGRQSKSDSVVYQSYAGYVLVNYFSYVTADKNTDKYVFIKDAISNLLKAFEASTINYKDRITSYNVCYTKLLRPKMPSYINLQILLLLKNGLIKTLSQMM